MVWIDSLCKRWKGLLFNVWTKTSETTYKTKHSYFHLLPQWDILTEGAGSGDNTCPLVCAAEKNGYSGSRGQGCSGRMMVKTHWWYLTGIGWKIPQQWQCQLCTATSEGHVVLLQGHSSIPDSEVSSSTLMTWQAAHPQLKSHHNVKLEVFCEWGLHLYTPNTGSWYPAGFQEMLVKNLSLPHVLPKLLHLCGGAC